MVERRQSKPRGLNVLIYIGAWTAWTVFMSALIAFDEEIPFVYAAWCNIVLFGIAAVLALPVMSLASRLAARRMAMLSVLAAIVTSFAFAIIWVWLCYWLFNAMFGSLFTANLFDPRSGWIFLTGLVMAAVVYGIAAIRQYSRHLHEAELRRAELQYLAKEAELRALRSQVNPHFLFNSLNSVYSMIDSNAAGAKDMVIKLSDLLRQALSASDSEFMSLKDDWEFSQRYLDIEKVRLGNRLHIDAQIDEDVLAEQVPSLLLQPLVENAIKHGASKTDETVTIRVSASRNGSHMRLEVADDAGVTPGATDSGRGLANLGDRLQRIYGDNYELSAGPADGGFRVALVLPIKKRESAE